MKALSSLLNPKDHTKVPPTRQNTSTFNPKEVHDTCGQIHSIPTLTTNTITRTEPILR